jgi:hypothetical protein
VGNLDPRTCKDCFVDEEIPRDECRGDSLDYLQAPSEVGLTPNLSLTSAPVPPV